MSEIRIRREYENFKFLLKTFVIFLNLDVATSYSSNVILYNNVILRTYLRYNRWHILCLDLSNGFL